VYHWLVDPVTEPLVALPDVYVEMWTAGEPQAEPSVVRGDVDVLGARLEARARVSRRDVHMRDPRRLRDLPGERVLAAARPDDQYLHDRVNAGSGACP
jgi:hypothetical protein